MILCLGTLASATVPAQQNPQSPSTSEGLSACQTISQSGETSFSVSDKSRSFALQSLFPLLGRFFLAMAEAGFSSALGRFSLVMAVSSLFSVVSEISLPLVTLSEADAICPVRWRKRQHQ